VIDLDVNSVHAACAVTGGACAVAWRENVEGGIRHIHPSGKWGCTVYSVVSNGIVLVEQEASLNPSDFYKRRYVLPISIHHSATGSWLCPSWRGRARRKPSFGLAFTWSCDPGVVDAASLDRSPK